MSTVLLTGATGFVGRNVARELSSRGVSLRALVRRTANIQPLSGLPVQFAYGDVTDPASLEAAAQGSDTVIHLVAVIRERGRATFEAINHQGTVNVVRACQRAGVKRLVYMSNVGARHDQAYPFLYSKWLAEEDVKGSGIPYTIFRSSLMYGSDDEFTRKLAQLVRTAIVVPIIGAGRTKFQPIAVADTARCLAMSLESPGCVGRTIEIGGPEHLTYERMVDAIITVLGKRRLKVHMPLLLMKPTVALMERLIPSFPVSSGQLKMLSIDNVTSPDAVEKAFGFRPARFRDSLGYLKG